jgi:hypothetical protein
MPRKVKRISVNKLKISSRNSEQKEVDRRARLTPLLLLDHLLAVLRCPLVASPFNLHAVVPLPHTR